MNLDKFDIAILEALQKDARISLQELGRQIGLTSTPCWNRVRRMEEAGVIEGYSVRVNPEQIGLTLFDFGQALEAIPEVMEAFLVSGDYDYYIRVAVEGTRGYERFLRERLYKIPGIRHSKSSFVLRRLKQSLVPLRRSPVVESGQSAHA